MDRTELLMHKIAQDTDAWGRFKSWGDETYKPAGGWGWANAANDTNYRMGGAFGAAGLAGGAALGGMVGGRRGAAVGGMIAAPLMAALGHYAGKQGWMPKLQAWLAGLGKVQGKPAPQGAPNTNVEAGNDAARASVAADQATAAATTTQGGNAQKALGYTRT
jgi:hypothetical protein